MIVKLAKVLYIFLAIIKNTAAEAEVIYDRVESSPNSDYGKN